MAIQTWREVYRGGSPEAETEHFRELARDIVTVQERMRRSGGRDHAERAFHAKAIVATADAEFQILEDLPADLQVEFVQPGAVYPATVRISNASGAHQADTKRDLRGLAIRVHVGERDERDLLMTNFPVPHARDGEQFIAFALAMSGSRLLAVPRLLRSLGFRETVRMLRNVAGGSKRAVRSVALESYWSRGASLWGDAGPVRYLVRPAQSIPPVGDLRRDHPDYLRHEVGQRLLAGDVVYEFCVQRYLNEERTPIEDAAHEWREGDTPAIPVARLIIHQQSIFLPEAMSAAHEIEALAFSPWNITDSFRPLGNLNRARKLVYEASAAHRA